MPNDPILNRFLQRQQEDAKALTEASDVVSVMPLFTGPGLAQHFLVRFSCFGYVKNGAGEVAKHDRWDVGVYFADDYLRTINPGQVVTLLYPNFAFHPNIVGGYVCLGERFYKPGLPLLEIAMQVFLVITYQKWSGQGLNEEASLWAMNNAGLFPVDRRTLKRRALGLDIELTKGGRK